MRCYLSVWELGWLYLGDLVVHVWKQVIRLWLFGSQVLVTSIRLITWGLVWWFLSMLGSVWWITECLNHVWEMDCAVGGWDARYAYWLLASTGRTFTFLSMIDSWLDHCTNVSMCSWLPWFRASLDTRDDASLHSWQCAGFHSMRSDLSKAYPRMNWISSQICFPCFNSCDNKTIKLQMACPWIWIRGTIQFICFNSVNITEGKIVHEQKWINLHPQNDKIICFPPLQR